MEGLLLTDLQRSSGLSRDDGEAPRTQTRHPAAEEKKTGGPVKPKSCSSFSSFKGEEPYQKKKKGVEKTNKQTQKNNSQALPFICPPVQGPIEGNELDYIYKKCGSRRKC